MFYINSDISKFFYYINLPCNTSSTLLKRTFVESLKYNCEINFNLLKNICTKINLEWHTELYLLRRTLKNWYKQNCNYFAKTYPYFEINKQDGMLKIINNIYSAYLTKQHNIAFYDLYNIIDEYGLDNKKDMTFLKHSLALK